MNIKDSNWWDGFAPLSGSLLIGAFIYWFFMNPQFGEPKPPWLPPTPPGETVEAKRRRQRGENALFYIIGLTVSLGLLTVAVVIFLR